MLEKLKAGLALKSKSERAALFTGWIISGVIIVLAITQITGLWESAIMIMEPLLGINMLLQAYQHRKQNKMLALFSLGVAVFIFVVAGFIFSRMILG